MTNTKLKSYVLEKEVNRKQLRGLEYEEPKTSVITIKDNKIWKAGAIFYTMVY